MVNASRRNGEAVRSGACKRLALLLGLLWLGVAGSARAVTCVAEVDRVKVAPGGRLMLTVTIEGEFQRMPEPRAPEIDGVEVRAGGTSQSVQFTLGRVASRLEMVWHLTVRRNDSFRIPPLAIEVDGAVYNTQPIAIEVVPGAAPSAPPAGRAPTPAPGPGRSVPAPPSGGAGRPGDPFFVTLQVDRPRAWVGEQVLLVFRFHRAVALWDSPQYRAPRTEGFWREDLPPERSYAQTIAGTRYEVTEIRYALFPTRAGRLAVEPAEVTVPPDPFARLERMFGGTRAAGSGVVLRTPALAVEVRELPTPRPDDYSGLVAGKVELEAGLDPRETPRGEPVTLRLALRADGFLKSFAGIPMPELPDAELHDAGETLDVDKGGDRLVSRMTVEKVLVPRREGEQALPAVRLSYFDPVAGRFALATAALGALRVGPGSGPETGDGGAELGAPLERVGTDLAFIHPAPARLRRATPPLVARPGWWGAALLPAAGLGGLRWWIARRRRIDRDPASWRRSRALAAARRALRQGGRGSSGVDPAAVARAVVTYVADRTARAPSTVGAAEVVAYAASVGATATGDRLAGLLAACDEARFGLAAGSPGAAEGEVLAAEALTLLGELERSPGGRSLSRGVAGLVGLLLLAGAPARAAAPDGPATEATSGASAAQLVAEGNAAYTAGDNGTAVARYRAALASGVADPVVYYNLGNACARRGELGRAVLAYRAALRLAPRDRDARANLDFVRARTRDRNLQESALPPVLAQLAHAVGFLSLDEWSLTLLLLLWALAALIATAWWRGVVGDRLRRAIIATAVAVVLVAGIVVWRHWDEHGREEAAIVVTEAEVRSGPAETFPVLFRVHDGLLLTVRGREDGWVRIGLGGEWVGWTPAVGVESVERP